MEKHPISTYVINLKNRIDRREHIQQEFVGRNEFKVHLIPAFEHNNGAIGLWNTIQHIVKNLIDPMEEFIILCEDDHTFTETYSAKVLLEYIACVKEMDADILLGGVSWFKGALQVSDDLFWVDLFNGTQFVIVFRRFYAKIVEAKFSNMDLADKKISELSKNKFFIHPFISLQKDFGYSDATPRNNMKGKVEELFTDSSKRAQALKDIALFYKNNPIEPIENIMSESALDNLSIPTYIINLPERIDRQQHILKEFEGKPEFDVKLTKAVKHRIGAVGLWMSIRAVVQQAIENDDDVIIICEDDHEFTPDYSKSYMFQNIIEAHAQGADYLSGGTGGFSFVIPVAKNRYWVNPCYSTQFIIVYKKFFKQILDEPYDETVIADILLPSMTIHKMVIFPFISRQRDFGYSDVTPMHHDRKGFITRIFQESSNQLNEIHYLCRKYKIV